MERALTRIGLRDAGERGAFVGVLAAAIIVLLIGLWFGLQRTDRELGSNAVGVGAVVANVAEGDELCINSLYVPDGTERIELYAGPAGAAAKMDLTFVNADGEVAVKHDIPVDRAGLQFFEAPKTSWPTSETEKICLTPTETGVNVGGAGLNRLPSERAATIEGEALPASGEPAIHFYSGGDDKPLEIQLLKDTFARSAPFHGPLFPYVVFLTMLLAFIATGFALRAVIVADRLTVKRIAWTMMVVCFTWCLAWAVMSPPFQGNDESEHYAMLEYTSATGQDVNVSVTKNKRPPYSSQEDQMMRGVHHNTVVVDRSGRPFWTTDRSDIANEGLADASRSDGGGFTGSSSGHSPFYYGMFAPFYQATKWMQPANQLVAMRAVQGFSAAFVALFAVFAAALLLGDKRRRAAAVAGSLVAAQPMFAYVNGTINNDTIVNTAGAAMLYLLLLIARKGWEVRREIWVGVISIISPLGKLTGVGGSLYAAAIVLLLVLRDRSKRSIQGGLTVLAAVIVTELAWLGFASVMKFQKMLVYQHTDGIPGPPEWVPTTLQKIDYIIQLAFPFIKITGPMTGTPHAFEKIYIVGGFADFFWHRFSFPVDVYKLILSVLLVVFFTGIVGLIRYRGWALKNWLPIAIVVLQPVFVYCLVHWAYATPGGRAVPAEQGRYIFPALAALAVIAAAAVYGLPKRLREYGWGALAGAMGAFGVVCYAFGILHVYA
ncbi:MAG: DUF2142 domain-containing protein [Solirubrobacterales bacterium]